ncbi:hypothetical protein BDA96_02G434100 [Sorghum bicolor]|uniref:Gamma-tubulin complex component n=2 Tax=Sorghum bicolor TaxID=4558 RepID=A0A921UWD2_SORBI|nr:hypothetical protein BDA96_02G434100 [Sorghum bicolor]KXG36924.1 hypothetical protein SORBI_3002G413800 [Sorghum bicolor]
MIRTIRQWLLNWSTSYVLEGFIYVQGLWFFCQRMMSSLNAQAVLVEKATSNNTNGSATHNLLQSQAKAMGGDSAVWSLLEKMTEYAMRSIQSKWIKEDSLELY